MKPQSSFNYTFLWNVPNRPKLYNKMLKMNMAKTLDENK